MKGRIRAFRAAAISIAVVSLFTAGLGVAAAQEAEPTEEQGQQADLERERGHERFGQFVARLASNLGVPEEAVRSALRQTMEEMRPLMRERMRAAMERFRRWHEGAAERFEGREGFGQLAWLASQLGVSEEAARSALRQTMEEMRPLMRERMRPMMERPWREPSGVAPMGPSEVGRAAGPMGPELIVGLTSQILGIPPESLMPELQRGKPLAQIAQEHGVAPEALADQLTGRLEQLRVQQMREGILRFLTQPLAPPSPAPATPE